MNESEHDLKRLFHSAAQAPQELPGEPSHALEQRIIACWRNRAGAVEEWFTHLPLYRRALAAACVLALVALAVYFQDLTQEPADDVKIINTPVSLTSLP